MSTLTADLEILRKKLLSLEGFANALRSSQRKWLVNWVNDAQMLANKAIEDFRSKQPMN